MPGSARNRAAGGGQGDRQASRRSGTSVRGGRQTKSAQTSRRSGAQPATKSARKPQARKGAFRVSWSRRIGVALGLLILVGVSIAFAGQALDNRAPSDPGARNTHAPPPAPALLPLQVAVTREHTVDLQGTLPADLAGDRSYTLRIYVNGTLAREGTIPSQTQFNVAAVPLDEGDNQIQAAIHGDVGESALSAAVSIARDDVAPIVRITRPADGEMVYGQTETLRGKTEAGASISLIDEATGHELQSTVSADGRFEATLRLTMGTNKFVINSQDVAGNPASTRFTVTRDQSLATIDLTVSATDILTTDLPATIQVHATIRDALGHPAEGVEVTFGLSPPNRTTTTYRVTASGGVANWADVLVGNNSQSVGTWLVTVLAVLPSGEELRGDASFSVH